MYWEMHTGMGWWILFGILWMLLFWGIIIGLIVWGVRAITQSAKEGDASGPSGTSLRPGRDYPRGV